MGGGSGGGGKVGVVGGGSWWRRRRVGGNVSACPTLGKRSPQRRVQNMSNRVSTGSIREDAVMITCVEPGLRACRVGGGDYTGVTLYTNNTKHRLTYHLQKRREHLSPLSP